MLRGVDAFQDQSCSPTDELMSLVRTLNDTMATQQLQAQPPISCGSLFQSPEKDSGERIREERGTNDRETDPVVPKRGRRQSMEVSSTVVPVMMPHFNGGRIVHMDPEPEERTQCSVAHASVQTAMTGPEKREKIAAMVEKERAARVMEKSAQEWKNVVEELEQERINLLQRVSEAKRELERGQGRESKLQIAFQHLAGQVQQQQNHEGHQDHDPRISHALAVASRAWNRKCEQLLLRNTISQWKHSYMSRQTAMWKGFIRRKNMEHTEDGAVLHETVGMWKDKTLRRKAVDARIQLKEEQALVSTLFDWRRCSSSASASRTKTEVSSNKTTLQLCRAFHIWSGLAKLTSATSSAKYALLLDIKGRAAVASAARRATHRHFAMWKAAIFPGTSKMGSGNPLRRSNDTNTTGTLSTKELDDPAPPLRVFRLRRSPPNTPPRKRTSGNTVRETMKEDADAARRRTAGAEDPKGRNAASSGRGPHFSVSRRYQSRRRSSSSSSQASSSWNRGMDASGEGGEKERRRARLRVIDWQTRATNQWRGSFLARKVLREWHKFSMQERHVLSVLSNFYPEFDYG